MSRAWKKIRPLLPRIVGLIVVPFIFYRLLTPIINKWDAVHPYLEQVRWDLLALACLMFAINQYMTRLISWRIILAGLGYHLPRSASARIWVTSELARYIPGAIWQVVGRAALAKPYGLPMTTCSVSQVLELTFYLLANVMVAVATLSFMGSQIAEPRVQLALRLATFLIPALLILLHPRIFYPMVNMALRRIHRPPILTRLSGLRMVALMGLALGSVLWLGVAIWLATYSILHVPFKDAWILSGAYCLAWSAGFCMGFMASGGLGIRELVLSAGLTLLLSNSMGTQLDPATRMALLAAVALMLRLWATTGELIFAAFAYLWDWRNRTRANAPATAFTGATSLPSTVTVDP